MRIPKHQWLTEQPTQQCGFCDELFTEQVDGDIGKKFQVILDEALIEQVDMSQNPFDLITSTDLNFFVNHPINYSTELQLYIEGKAYIFRWSVDDSITVVGNTSFIYVDDAGGDAIKDARLRLAMATYIDPVHGTTSTYSFATGITIEDVPSGSYLNNLGHINTITSVLQSDFDVVDFVWSGSTLCHSISSEEIVESEPSITFHANLISGYNYYISVPYITSHLGYTYQLSYANGMDTNAIPIPPASLTQLSGELVFNFQPENTGTYTFTLTFTDINSVGQGLCIRDISLYTLYEDGLTVYAIDCNGNSELLEVEGGGLSPSEIFYKKIRLTTILDELPNIFKLRINNNSPYGGYVESRYYTIYDQNNCVHQQLIKIDWTNSCKLGDLEYAVLPFTNNLYLFGVLIKQSNDLFNSIENTTASGTRVSVYKNTQSLYEFRMNPYLAETLENVLEGVFMHNSVTINNTEYNATQSVDTNEISMGIYMGKVDVYKSGTNLISMRCC